MIICLIHGFWFITLELSTSIPAKEKRMIAVDLSNS